MPDPGPRCILLSGELPDLAREELASLLAVHDPDATCTGTRIVRVMPGGDGRGTDTALGRMALAHAWGTWWAEARDDADGHARLAAAVAAHADGTGSAAVRVVRAGDAKSPNKRLLERLLGQVLVDAGHTIRLTAPDLEVFAWILDGSVTVGRLHGKVDRTAQDARAPERRAHFSPVGLHPRIAAALVHLARVPPGGRVLDPFCGTGGFLLEAALEGLDAWGSDVDPWMVQGSLQTLADAGVEPLDGTVFVADIGAVPDLMDGVDGIVTDLPYGQASTTCKEDVATLYARAADACAALLARGKRLVVGIADPTLLTPFEEAGFSRVSSFHQYVHKRLTRHFVVFARTGAGRRG